MTTRVAIMQPYFVPYLGYFRLFTTTDVFVVLDSVQFPSEGYVHRNQLPDRLGRPQWLKLPLARTPLHTPICDLAFRPNAQQVLQAQFRRFPDLDSPRDAAAELMRLMMQHDVTPVEFLIRTMRYVCYLLDAPWRVVRSSEMLLPDELRGQDRVVEIVRRLGGKTYVNSPGGRQLYDPETFAHAGITLRFLPNYTGEPWSVLRQLSVHDVSALRAEVHTDAMRFA